MSIREAEPADAARIHEVAESAMTSSHALSPGQIESIAEEQFGDESVDRKVDASDTVLLVAESEEDANVVGVAEGALGEGRGELRWLFVDPEHRGGGHGSALFEAAVDELDERGARSVQAASLDANQEGREFFERFGFEQTDSREVELGGEMLQERVYARDADPEDVDDEGETADSGATTEEATPGADAERVEFPDDGTADADGQTVYLSEEEPLSGTDGPFFESYTDEDREERYGYYCGNCGSTETTMGDMERIECQNCGNVHESKGSEQYDDGYL